MDAKEKVAIFCIKKHFFCSTIKGTLVCCVLKLHFHFACTTNAISKARLTKLLITTQEMECPVANSVSQSAVRLDDQVDTARFAPASQNSDEQFSACY
jgi:hypothetical protein